VANLPAPDVQELYHQSEPAFQHWEIIKDLIDETIDLTLNYRQSGHPGGSRSKVHLFVSTLLSGAMHWDLLRPWRPFSDRFVLSAGHTVPLVYSTLAVFNEAIRERHQRGGGTAFAFPDDGRWALTWEDLMMFRRRGGLAGHAEFEGKTLFLKFNTGPSGHGQPAAVGEALALKLAGAEDVKVFVMEGEGGLTPGGSHESRNSAWGLGLSNLIFLVDWNDFGIDDNPLSSVVHGTPVDWFEPYGWRVTGTEKGMEWATVTRAVLEAARGDNPARVPSMAWVKTRKGRGYGKYDNKSHGTPHKMNSPEFWAIRKPFMEKYGVEYQGVDQLAPADPAARREQAMANFRTVMSVLHRHDETLQYLSNRLLEVACHVPDRIASFNLGGRGAEIFNDERICDPHQYPASIWAKPGDKQPNRAALGTWGAWVNAYAKKEYGRPLFIACSADLAESTNLAGFMKDYDGMPGWGWYQRDKNPRGALLPQQITEFANAAICAGLATVNLADDPAERFNGFWSACSTYASFSYLKYGPMRLFSQLAQDCELRVGKVLWVAGHAGPETAEDSRTHFGIFETAVMQAFPFGQIINLHPSDYNEVLVVLAAAFRQKAPIVVLNLARPVLEIPDRQALGMGSYFEAARGAYLIRDFEPGKPRGGTVYIQGPSCTANLIKILPELSRAGLNVKIVAVISPQLFALQNAEYRESILSVPDRLDAMCITSRALRLMWNWMDHRIVAEYSLSPDWDNRWRTGGSVDEVVDEAHLSPKHIFEGIERFVRERELRLRKIRSELEAAENAR
jgi:transketolase